MIDFGDVPAGSVLPIKFASYGGTDGESITLTGLAVSDVEVYGGTSMTQRASDNGIALLDTDGIDIDGITGIHGFSIDLSDNSDSGFYAVGTRYTVIVSAVTIDSQTVNFIAAQFRIVAAETIAGTPKVDVGGISGDATAADTLELFAEALDQSTGQIDSGTFANDAITAAVIANGAIDAATFAADVDAEILSYIVDDATRIDASALNTATGTTIPSINSELAKVPKSDGTVSWNATALAAINAQCDTALADYDGPTNAEMVARTLTSASYATASGLTLVAQNVHEFNLSTLIYSDPNQAGARIQAIYTDTHEIQGAYATAAELAKVPKSDGSTSWNATALASINAECDTALADVGLTTTVTNRIDAAVSTRATQASVNDLPTLAQILAGGDIDSYTLEQALKVILANAAGKLSGAATATNVIRAADDSKARITATVDADGNRSAVTIDATG